MEKHIFRQKSAPIRKKAVFSYFISVGKSLILQKQIITF